MRTFIFKSEVSPDLGAFSGDLAGLKLPSRLSPGLSPGARSAPSHRTRSLRINYRAVYYTPGLHAADRDPRQQSHRSTITDAARFDPPAHFLARLKRRRQLFRHVH